MTVYLMLVCRQKSCAGPVYFTKPTDIFDGGDGERSPFPVLRLLCVKHADMKQVFVSYSLCPLLPFLMFLNYIFVNLNLVIGVPKYNCIKRFLYPALYMHIDFLLDGGVPYLGLKLEPLSLLEFQHDNFHSRHCLLVWFLHSQHIQNFFSRSK